MNIDSSQETYPCHITTQDPPAVVRRRGATTGKNVKENKQKKLEEANKEIRSIRLDIRENEITQAIDKMQFMSLVTTPVRQRKT